MSYKQPVSIVGELKRANQCKSLLLILEDLYDATSAEGKVNITAALATAKTSIDSLITAIEA